MDFYHTLETTAEFAPELMSLVRTKDTKEWINRFSFDILPLPNRLPFFTSNKAIAMLMKQFNVQPIIIRIDPMRFYRFHVDDFRGAALNLLLDGWDSQTYFSNTEEDPYLTEITELKYAQNKMYLLNTQIKHAVVNKNNLRYVLSMGFNQPLTYDEVKRFCVENNL